MVNGLNVSGSICIYRGGIRPHETLSLLPSSIDILHPNNYSNISSVTVVVGTNALNVNRPNAGMPLLDVVEDYEKLIHDLRKLFSRARLGLYNILPRAFRCHETRERIQIFKIFVHETSFQSLEFRNSIKVEVFLFFNGMSY